MALPSHVELIPVTSSNVSGYAYEPDFHRLWVEFGRAKLYRYEGFPPAEWQAFQAAPSKGTFVYQRIRNYGKDNLYAYAGPFAA